jgi:hypothetical protein
VWSVDSSLYLSRWSKACKALRRNLIAHTQQLSWILDVVYRPRSYAQRNAYLRPEVERLQVSSISVSQAPKTDETHTRVAIQ